MTDSWIHDELNTANFNDKRLHKRLATTLAALAARPNASLPLALGGRHELKAAYRLVDHANVSPKNILKAHCDATTKRCQTQSVVLSIQDTSELDFTRPQQPVKDAGPLDGSARRGAFLHMNQAFTPDGLPLGAVSAKLWARETPDPEQPKLSPAEKRKKTLALPIEKKESYRWLEGMHATQELTHQCADTLCVNISDSEGDIYDLLAFERTADNFHWLIRACQDRVVLDQQGETCILRESLEPLSALFSYEITVRARKALVSCETRSRRSTRVGRQATVEVRAGNVTIKAPAASKLAVRSVCVHAVLVREVNPPTGEVAVEWMLLTTLPISTIEEIRLIIHYYTVRWMIEIFFRTLKSGCRIEDRRFETLERMLTCTSLYLIVAWRTLFVCYLGRSCPDLPCDVVFGVAEWQSVWRVKRPGESVPERAPPLGVMIRLIAGLGGYVERPRRLDAPGVETLWKGLQRMQDLAWAWETFGPDSKAKG